MAFWPRLPSAASGHMPKYDDFLTDPAKDSPPSGANRPTVSSRLDEFEKRQRDLWRLTFLILFLISIGFAVVSWGTIRNLTQRLEPLLPGLVVIVVLFIGHAWKRTQEISELRGLVRGLEQHDAAPPSDRQLN